MATRNVDLFDGRLIDPSRRRGGTFGMSVPGFVPRTLDPRTGQQSGGQSPRVMPGAGVASTTAVTPGTDQILPTGGPTPNLPPPGQGDPMGDAGAGPTKTLPGGLPHNWEEVIGAWTPRGHGTSTRDIPRLNQSGGRIGFNSGGGFGSRGTELIRNNPNPVGPQDNSGRVGDIFGGSTYDAFNNLRDKQFLPETSGRTEAAQGFTDESLALLMERLKGLDGPNRGQLANETFDLLRTSTRPAFEEELRGVGRSAAAFGRIGSGMTTNDLGTVQQRREEGLANAQRGLSLDAAGMEMSDLLNRLNATQSASGHFSGIEGQRFGQDVSNRGELRTERDFQNMMARLAIEDRIRQLTLEDDLTNSAFNREQARLGLIGSNAFYNPVNAYLGAR